MNMNSNFYRGGKVLLILSMAFLFTGCMKMTQNIIVLENGTMEIESIQDATQLNETEGMGSETETDEELCEKASIKEVYELEAETCEVSEDKNITFVRGERMLMEEEFQSQNGYFRFYKGDITQQEGEQGMTFDPEGIAMFRSSGMELSMNLTMPGEIVATNKGIFLGNKVEIDLLLEMEKQELANLIVISKIEGATGDVPWDISGAFITESGVVEEKNPGNVSEEKLALADELGSELALAFQSLGSDISESEGETEHTMRPITTDTPQYKPSSPADSDLPASGGENVFLLLWQWIISLF